MPDSQLNPNELRERFKLIESKRDTLIRLLEQPD